MGVDINFYIEVRKRDRWRPLVFKTPTELMGFVSEEEKGKEWRSAMCIYGCRYYHFQDFLEDESNGQRRLPDDCCEELRKELHTDDEDYAFGRGYFMLNDLIHYCDTAKKEMLKHLLHSRDYQMVEQLNRIEKTVRGENIPKTDLPDTDIYADMTIEEIYSDYEESYGLLNDLCAYIHEALEISGIYYPSTGQVRVIYCYG